MSKKFWDFKNAAKDIGELYVYGVISSYKWDDTDTTAQSFKDDLEALGDIKTLNIYVNSPGGSVFQAQAIHTILKRHTAKKNAYIDALAASAASFLIASCDVLYMPKNAMQMIHLPESAAWGNAKVMRKEAEKLDKVCESMIEAYMARGKDKINEEKLREMLDAETWLTAQECYDYGLCDELIEEKDVAACIDTETFARYRNPPKELVAAVQKPKETLDTEVRQRLLEACQASNEAINKILKFQRG